MPRSARLDEHLAASVEAREQNLLSRCLERLLYPLHIGPIGQQHAGPDSLSSSGGWLRGCQYFEKASIVT